MDTSHNGVLGREQRMDEAVLAYLQAVEAGLAPDRAEWLARLQQAADWSGAAGALERARGRLDRGGPTGLRLRLDQAGCGLDEARRDHSLVPRLEAIRLARLTLAEGRFNPAAQRRSDQARADRAYEAAFREAGVGAPGDDAAAARGGAKQFG